MGNKRYCHLNHVAKVYTISPPGTFFNDFIYLTFGWNATSPPAYVPGGIYIVYLIYKKNTPYIYIYKKDAISIQIYPAKKNI